MMARANLTDMATLKTHGYTTPRLGNLGWQLLDPEGHELMIAGYGCIAPTQWEAVAEGLHRIQMDEQAETLWQARINGAS